MNRYVIKKSNELALYVVLFFICLATMNMINKYYYFTYIAFAFFCIFVNRTLRIKYVPVLSLLLLAVSWMLFSPDAAVSTLSLIKPFTYLLCFLMGRGLFNDDLPEKKNAFKVFYLLVGAIAIGALIHYLLNWSINASDFETRNTIDFWTQSTLSATGQAAIACLPLALAVACLFFKNNKIIKILSFASLIVILGYNLILSGRTLIVLLLLAVAAAFLYKLIVQKDRRYKTLIVFLIIVLLVIFLYQIDLFEVKTTVEASPLYERFFGDYVTTDINEDERLEKKIKYIENIWSCIWGGNHLREKFEYAHDIFLDTLDEAGVFALIAVVAYIISSFVNLIKCITNRAFPFALRQIVLCTYLTIYAEFMIEPVLQGMPWLFASFCLIDGYVSYLVSENKSKAGVNE